MGKKGVEQRRGRRPGVVTSATRRGPGQGFWIALGAATVLGLGVLGYVASRPRTPAARQFDPNVKVPKPEGYLLGSPSAPVEVTEFADFECPGCGQFATVTEPDVRAKLVQTGQVRMRFIDYPLPMHKNTWDASLAAACANDQGKFWPMHDAIFANQDRWNGEATSRPRSVLAELAKGIGLDMGRYDACMSADTHRAKIEQHEQYAQQTQVTQTPTFVIGGQMYPGALPYDAFRKLVDSVAKAAPVRGGDSAAPSPAAGETTGAAARGTGR